METAFSTPDLVPAFFADRFPALDPEIVRADFARRYELAREWITAAETVGQAASDLPEAVETVEFIRTRLAPGFLMPRTGSYLFAETMDSESHQKLTMMRPLFWQATEASHAAGDYQAQTLLVPLTSLDRESAPGEELLRLLGRWMPNFRIGADLSSGQLTRLLVLPPHSSEERISQRGKGVLMLYETRHAMGIGLGSPSEEDLDFWRAQAALNWFEFAVLERLGGTAYTSVVARYSQALRRERDLLARPDKVLDRRMRRWLTQIFGATSDRETHLWASVAYRNAIAQWIDFRDGFALHLMEHAT